MILKILEIAMLIILAATIICISAIAAGVIREALDEMRKGK
jgi:hypothetical protein